MEVRMDHGIRAGFIIGALQLHELLLRHHVDRMRQQRRLHLLVALQGGAEVRILLHKARKGLVVPEVEQARLGEHRLHAAAPYHLCAHITMEVHVVEARRATLQHLVASELRAPLHELLRLLQGCLEDELALRGEDVLEEPVVQGQVVGIAPEQGHGRVRVRIDEPRDNEVMPQMHVTLTFQLTSG